MSHFGPSSVRRCMNRAARARAVWKPLLFPTLLVLAACSTRETKRDDKIYQAYGDTWIYSKTEFNKQYLGFNSPHAATLACATPTGKTSCSRIKIIGTCRPPRTTTPCKKTA